MVVLLPSLLCGSCSVHWRLRSLCRELLYCGVFAAQNYDTLWWNDSSCSFFKHAQTSLRSETERQKMPLLTQCQTTRGKQTPARLHRPLRKPDLSLYSACLSPGKKKIKAAVGEKNPKQILILPVKWLKVMRLISREWGHSVSSLAHNFQSSDPNVLSRALIIICNCSMKRAISLQWNTLSTSGWASTTNLFPRDQLKWAITIFSFLNNSLNGRIIKKNEACRSEKHNFNWESG